MYDGLREVAPELLLPGLQNVEADSVALLETSPRVIEAYMVGLNHEMNRELLWREFPADLAGTPFRQFWDVRGQRGAPETLRDIPPISTWGATGLGTHVRGSNAGGQLVLLVRGELLRRYPTTTIYAVRANADGTLAASTRLAPMFRGFVAPDVVFAGFALTEEAALGTDPAGPGWYFAFEEHPGEPRFGFDEQAETDTPQSPNDLAWPHVPLSSSGHVDVLASAGRCRSRICRRAGDAIRQGWPRSRCSSRSGSRSTRPGCFEWSRRDDRSQRNRGGARGGAGGRGRSAGAGRSTGRSESRSPAAPPRSRAAAGEAGGTPADARSRAGAPDRRAARRTTRPQAAWRMRRRKPRPPKARHRRLDDQLTSTQELLAELMSEGGPGGRPPAAQLAQLRAAIARLRTQQQQARSARDRCGASGRLRRRAGANRGRRAHRGAERGVGSHREHRRGAGRARRSEPATRSG